MVIDHSDSVRSKTKQFKQYVSSRVKKKDDSKRLAGGVEAGNNVSIEVVTAAGLNADGMKATALRCKAVSALNNGGGLGPTSRRLRGESECSSSNASTAQLIKVIYFVDRWVALSLYLCTFFTVHIWFG